MKKIIRITIGAAIILIGLGIYVYPDYCSWKLSQRTNRLISEFHEKYSTDTENTEEQDEADDSAVMDYQNLYNEMLEYNIHLAENGQQLVDAWSYAQEPMDLSELSDDDGAIGYIEIPAMDVTLPLYIGATAENMAKGAAVMSETSMPIGGTDTNCVIAGHRGYSGMPYFREIEKLETGDRIYVTNIWETLVYEVKQINVIEPDDIEAILIIPEKDMITLLTCHPYMSHGKYRYVVYCERVAGTEENQENSAAGGSDADQWAEKDNITGTIVTSFSGINIDSSEPVILIEKILRILIPAGILLFLIHKRRKRRAKKTGS